MNSLFEEEYKRRYVFGADYGTGDFKYGPITQGEKPLVVENRGYFPEPSLVSRIMGVEKEVVVGKDVALFLESGAELLRRMVYPMRSGVVGRDDARAWKVLKELTSMVLEEFKPRGFGFNGFYVVAALAATAPRYMYEKFFEIYREQAEKSLVKAATIIPQPLAVAIAHKATSCVVVEGGHGNTQVTPISRAPIREAIVALNRGGSDANAMTAEILKDAGYGDLAKEEAIVRKAKEQLGLLPLELDRAVAYAKQNPANVRKKVKIAGTRITIDLGELSWTRFLIAEYVFNPSNPVFESYFKRGMPRPADVRIGEQVFYGMTSIADSIIEAVEKCPVELQPHLYSQIILSGGNMSWTPPPELQDVAADAPTRVRFDLVKRGVENLNIRLTEDPQYAVWKGCIVYGYAVPADYPWSWETMEGWMRFRG